jgi:drug/metabolite transporter (DMT)-like permease
MTRRWLAVAALLAAATAWGATFTLIKHVLTQIAPEPFIFWRFMLAGVILCLAAWLRKRLGRDLLRPGLLLGLLLFIGYWAQTHGMLDISPSRSAFLTGLYVVMVPFADRLAYGTRVTIPAWLASILAAVGTAALIGGFDARVTWGDALTIFCAAIFALHIVFTARWSAGRSAMGLAAIQILFVGLLAAPFAAASAPTTFTPNLVAVIVFTAVVTTAIAFVTLVWAQSQVSATEAAVILAFEPVAASITSIFWDKEAITRGFVVGAVLILSAMILSQWRPKREK